VSVCLASPNTFCNTSTRYAVSAGQPLVAPAASALLAKLYGAAATSASASQLHHAAAACLAALTMRGKTSRKALASDAGACVLMLESLMSYGKSISSNIAISSKVIPEDWNVEAKRAAAVAASAAAAAATAACAITSSLLAAFCNLSQLDESRSFLGYDFQAREFVLNLACFNDANRYLSDDHVGFILKVISEGGGQPVIQRGLECALEMLGNFAREREGRKSITRLGFWQTALDSALKIIPNSITSVAADASQADMASLPASASDSLRHALVLLCRLYVKHARSPSRHIELYLLCNYS
jgi:hypothetical protein